MAPCQQWLETLPSPSGVLEEIQRNGRDAIFKQEFPFKALEEWRLTDLNRLEDVLKLPIATETSNQNLLKTNKWPEKQKCGFRIVLHPNCQPYNSLDLPPGLRVLTIDEIHKNIGNTLGLLNVNNDWPIRINEAATHQLLALKVEGRNVPPIELIMPAQTGEFVPTRVIILLEEQSKLELLQIALGSGNSTHSHILEIHLAKEAELEHGLIACGNGEASCMANLAIMQKNSSHYSLTSIQEGWNFSRFEPRILQIDGHATTTLKGLQVSDHNQQVATHSLVRFSGPDGNLDQLHKAVSKDKSHSIFNGLIEVPKIAQGTNAKQLSRNLLLSKSARIDTKPQLEIVADNVQCSHGATVSQLQEEELFYLCSRGISLNQSTSLLLKGYFQEIISHLPAEANRWEILDNLLGKQG